MLSGSRVSSSVSLNSDSMSRTASTLRLFGSSTRRTVSADSSRTSASSGSFFCEKLGDAGDKTRLRNLIRNLGDDDLIGAAPGVFLRPAGAEAEAAAPRLVSRDDLRARLDDHPAGGKIGTGNEIDQLVGGGVRKLDEVKRRVAQLARVVRRDIGRHADRDAGGAIRQQIGKGGGAPTASARARRNWRGNRPCPRRCHRGDARRPPSAAPRVAVGRRVIAVDIAEIALTVDQG